MNGTLAGPPPTPKPADLSNLVRELHREVLEHRQQVGDLQRENAERRQEVGCWKAMHVQAAERAERLEADAKQLRGENRKFQDQLFSRKSETAPGPVQSPGR